MVDFKEKGKDALACAVKGMHLTQGLQMLQSSLHSVMLSMDQKIDCLGEHGGGTACCQRASEKRISGNEWKSIHKLEQKTERLQQIGKLEERKGKQASLKDILQELRRESHALKPGKEEKQKSTVR